jgi:hypothetical protein
LQDAAPSWARLYVSHRARYLLARCGCGSIVWQLCTVRLWASSPLFPFLRCAAVIPAEQSSVVLFVWSESITLQRPRLWAGILLSIPLTIKIPFISKRSGVCVAEPGYTEQPSAACGVLGHPAAHNQHRWQTRAARKVSSCCWQPPPCAVVAWSTMGVPGRGGLLMECAGGRVIVSICSPNRSIAHLLDTERLEFASGPVQRRCCTNCMHV